MSRQTPLQASHCFFLCSSHNNPLIPWPFSLKNLRFYRNTAANFLGRFYGLYAAADAGTAFLRPHDALRAVSCFYLTQQSFVQFIQDSYRHYSRFAAEMVAAASLANYGQLNIDLNAFAGLVSLLPATDPRVFRIVQGNERLVEATLEAACATVHLHTRVAEIAATGDGTYHLTIETDEIIDSGGRRDGRSSNRVFKAEGPYDAVIIAAPLDLSSLSVSGIDLPVIPRRSYHRTITTVIRGVLRPTFFGEPPGTMPFSTVLVTEAAAAGGTPFASLARVAPLAGFKALWKIHSSTPVPSTWLGMLFEGGYEIAANQSWAAYPAFDPPENFPPFELAPGLYYPGAWESAASAMEMAAVGGRNVALLTAQRLQKQQQQQRREVESPQGILVQGNGREGRAAATAA